MRSPASSPARRRFLALALLASLALPALVHAQTRYTITNLGNTFSGRMAISSSGSIVASATTGGSTVIYSGGSTSSVPGLTIPGAIATGINASGAIVGFSLSASGVPAAFLVAGGVQTNLGQGEAVAINDAGTVAVYGSPTAYLRSTSGVVTQLPAPSDGVLFLTSLNQAGTTATGYFFGFDFSRRAVLATPAGMTELGTLLGGIRSEAHAINSAGVAVGHATLQGINGQRAVIFSGGTVTDLDPTGAGGERGPRDKLFRHGDRQQNQPPSGLCLHRRHRAREPQLPRQQPSRFWVHLAASGHRNQRCRPDLRLRSGRQRRLRHHPRLPS